jgi:hypothetical protein
MSVSSGDISSVHSVSVNQSKDSEAGTVSQSADTAPRGFLPEQENKALFRLRLLVMIVLLLAAISVSVVVYYITQSAEEEEFESQYEGATEKIIHSFEGIVKQKVGAISSVAVAMIAHGVDHARPWPFVTLSSFQQRSKTARGLSGALHIITMPIVNDTTRDEWEDYANEADSYWM